MRYGVIWRGLGGEPGQERDLYRWRGPDGREVLVYHLPPDGYEVGAGLPADAERLAAAWNRVRSVLVPRASTRHIPVFVGADHHSAHPALSRLRTLLQQIESDSEFRISRLQDFFARRRGRGRGPAGHLRRAALVVRLYLDPAGRSRHPRPAQAPARDYRAGALPGRGAACRAGAALPEAATAARCSAMPGAHFSRASFTIRSPGTTSDAVARRVELRLDDARNLASEIARTSLDELAGNIPDRARAEARGHRAPAGAVESGPVGGERRGGGRSQLVPPRCAGRAPRRSRVAGGAGLSSVSSARPSRVKCRCSRSAARRARSGSMRRITIPTRMRWTGPGSPFAHPRSAGSASRALETGEHQSAQLTGTRLAEGTRARQRVSRGQDRPERVPAAASTAATSSAFATCSLLESSGDVGDSYSYCPPVRDRVSRRVRDRCGCAHSRAVRWWPRWRLAGGWRRARRPGRALRDRRCPAHRHPVCRMSLGPLYARDRQPGIQPSAPAADQHRLARRERVAGDQFGLPRAAVAAQHRRGVPQGNAGRDRPGAPVRGPGSGPRGLAIFAPGFFEYELDRKGDLLVTLLRSVGELSRDDLPTRPGSRRLAGGNAAGPVPRRRAASARASRQSPRPSWRAAPPCRSSGRTFSSRCAACGCARPRRCRRSRSMCGSRATGWCSPG